jgi:hypothetical protein
MQFTINTEYNKQGFGIPLHLIYEVARFNYECGVGNRKNGIV